MRLNAFIQPSNEPYNQPTSQQTIHPSVHSSIHLFIHLSLLCFDYDFACNGNNLTEARSYCLEFRDVSVQNHSIILQIMVDNVTFECLLGKRYWTCLFWLANHVHFVRKWWQIKKGKKNSKQPPYTYLFEIKTKTRYFMIHDVKYENLLCTLILRKKQIHFP